MKKIGLFGLLFFFMLFFTVCNDTTYDEDINNKPELPGEDVEEEKDFDEELIPNSQEVDFENAIYIRFNNESVEIENPFEDNGVSIENENNHIQITSTLTDIELNYILSGVTENGSVKIYGNYKFGLVLNGVGITNPSGAVINIQCGKKITVTVVDLTNNRLIDGEEYVYMEGEDMKGTFFSEGQLNFYGNGSLEVRGKNKHAICTDDYFRMYEGNIWIKEAASDGVHANDYIRIDDGSLKVRAKGEGIECEKGYVVINGGMINIKTTGEKSHGIKSKDYTTINSDGTIEISVSGKASKGINCNGDMTIEKANLNITTLGDALYDSDEADISSSAGIKCDGDLVIETGNITIQSSGKGGKGINVSGSLVINDGTINVTTTGEQFTYDKDDTAAKAIKSTGDLTVNGGDITIRTYGVEAEGLESKATLSIHGGNLDIEAYDDCINASDHIEITGGNIYCNSTINDGIDSNGTLTISGGLIIAAGYTTPEAGIDCGNNRFSITRGAIIGIGGSTSAPTASACTQRSVIYNSSSAPEIIRIESTSGTEVLTFKSPRTYTRNITLLFSSPNLAANTNYIIYTGGSISSGSDFHGYYTGATYSRGIVSQTFTTNSMVTTVGNSNSGGRP
ncbi:MAG: carbohydrate-binding domain-containing protein [Odoribacter sp.]|nr:carbohydrate-binding domain-containing protein [Odoribacter sp.]